MNRKHHHSTKLTERSEARAAKAQGGDFAAYQRRIQNARRIAQRRAA